MKNCNICNREMPEWDDKNLAHHNHLVVTKSIVDGHFHTHGDLENKDAMAELIEEAKQTIGFTEPEKAKSGLTRNEFVFHNRQRIGDMLMFTCAVRDFKAAFPDTRINVISTCGHIWDYNPAIDRTLVPTEQNTVKIGPGKLTNQSNWKDWHMSNAFRMSMEENLGVHIPQGESRPDIWLTEEEYNSPRPFPMPYWIICTTGEKGWGCKMYPTHKWQEVINQNPDLTFVQIGTAEDNAPRLKGANVIDHIGKTQSREHGIRDLFKLFLHAEGSIGLVSFHMHLSGALFKPCVVIAGGREPVSFTRYAGHAYLSNDGMLPCAVKACWHCDINACSNLVIREESVEKKIPKCADMIESEDVTRAIRGYYKGVRLTLGTPIAKPKWKNLVKTPDKPVTLEPVVSKTAPYGMTWGGGCITDQDWDFMQATIEKYGIKSVLEFGCGLSTLLFTDKGLDVQSFETQQGWIDRIKELNPKANVAVWDGKDSPAMVRRFDFAFVDGPAGGVNRELSTKIAAEFADVVIVHDANREFERIWQDLYLKPNFDGPVKGGHRCHLWIRKNAKPAIVTTTAEAVKLPKGKQHIKLVSTARGWGGCARSCTTIMDLLLKAGHYVEFIPFRKAVSSSEYRQALSTTLKDVKVTTDYESIAGPCDVLLVYGDDFIWEFPTQEIANVFSHLQAERKVMMLNFRRGKVGEVAWTRDWDLYMFLNSNQEQDLLRVHPGVKTKVLPPCTYLEEFFKVKPNYERNIQIVRHSSQGDSKFSSTVGEEIGEILRLSDDIQMLMLPGPSFVPETSQFKKFPKTADPAVIAQFLSQGNVFWYSLPNGYMDMGPRVILEAMASGLAVVADKWGGAVDRVTPDCGWLCSTKDEHVRVFKNMTLAELKQKGEAARERAYQEFRPENWITILTK